MSCGPVTPNQQEIVLVNWMDETHLFFKLYLVLPFFYMTINIQKLIVFSVASMSCDPLTSEDDSKTVKSLTYFQAAMSTSTLFCLMS